MRDFGRLSILLGFNPSTLSDDIYSALLEPETWNFLEAYHERLHRIPHSRMTPERAFYLTYSLSQKKTHEERYQEAFEAQMRISQQEL